MYRTEGAPDTVSNVLAVLVPIGLIMTPVMALGLGAVLADGLFLGRQLGLADAVEQIVDSLKN